MLSAYVFAVNIVYLGRLMSLLLCFQWIVHMLPKVLETSFQGAYMRS